MKSRYNSSNLQGNCTSYSAWRTSPQPM